MRLTKIVCTLGPATANYEMLLKFKDLGVNVLRLNFSHGNYNDHDVNINLIKNFNEKENGYFAIMLDTKGPEIRCGAFENGYEDFKIGDIVKVSKKELLGTKEIFHIQCPELFEDIQVGNFILIDDGKQKITVLEKTEDILTCRVEINGPIKSNKGCNVPNVKLSMPFISDRDYKDIVFGCEKNVDYIAASFVRRAEDVLEIKKILKEQGKENIGIISKIESQEGFDNIDEICKVSEGIMVARGDLGVEVSTQLVPIYQKQMITVANSYGKTVITATHMLESMTKNPRPTRAESSDVANSVLDGTDCVMLSGESAVGDYPAETVEMMSQITSAAEKIIKYHEKLDYSKKTHKKTTTDAIGISVAEAALSLDIACIVCFTQSGSTAKRLSKFRPKAPILAIAFTKEVVRSLQAYWGVIPHYSETHNDMLNDDTLAFDICKKHGFKKGELIILCAGYPTGEGRTNMMKIIEIK